MWSYSAGRWSGGSFNGLHFKGKLRPAGGLDSLAKIVMGGPNLTIHPGLKNQPYHNQLLGALSGDGSAVEQKDGSVCGNNFLE